MANRRLALYFAWSRAREYATPSGVELSTPLGTLEDRYPTLFEFRRATWPAFESLRDPDRFNQGIAGFFDHIILPDFDRFRRTVKEVTGNEVPVIQREPQGSPPVPLDGGLLDGLDTLVVVSLDHLRTEQGPSQAELAAVKAFLARKDRCIVICPHHHIGADDSLDTQQVEAKHHGDTSVPARQRIGGFARSLLIGLGVPVVNRYGLSPAALPDGTPAPLVVNQAAPGAAALLDGVTTFNLHPHLPHLEVSPTISGQVEVLAQQAINPGAMPHPFTDAGNHHFNALLRVRLEKLPGLLLVCDATLWSSAFGGLASLTAFWRNVGLVSV